MKDRERSYFGVILKGLWTVEKVEIWLCVSEIVLDHLENGQFFIDKKDQIVIPSPNTCLYM